MTFRHGFALGTVLGAWAWPVGVVVAHVLHRRGLFG